MEKKEFTFYDLIEVLKKHWLIIILSAAILAALFGVYAVRSYKPQYSASITFYVSPSQGAGASTEQEQEQWSTTSDSQRLSWALRVINSYVQVLNSNKFAKSVDTFMSSKKEWNNTGLTNEEEEEMLSIHDKFGISEGSIRGALAYSVREDTNLFNVNITTGSREEALAISRAVQVKAPLHIENVTGAPKGTVKVSDTTEPYVSNSDNKVRNVVIGFVLGALISYIICFIVELLDVRIKNEEDLISNYDVPLLGTIPDYTADMKTTR